MLRPQPVQAYHELSIRVGYPMWFGFFVSFFVLLIGIFVWRFVARVWSAPHESASPPDDANVFARVKPRPRSGAGAVALEEPDEEEQ
jgi:hypothetical protein